ncbi:hypothetical protein BCV02_18300 [Vibrio breoganii]|uniref:Uncharacterized protein n=1 Tax=Vibrio breoganii TaxID=553239 RepID=A0ABX1UBY6_9VIBR|nr:hypothetical protein [Vibrio breoganii]MDN3718071.1 hypothetical protein [Vibrio breoganii]NMO75390.1 hypothetical protein [Vibrio breoganii]NMR71921.1 hypothetical protein [Vibrio breoganii]PMG04383.1 hypothetical protein BCV00_15170 [Vibrio breoganii]PMG06443.1 hypothetical protein BCV02_18300 [Vibrio breoganii]
MPSNTCQQINPDLHLDSLSVLKLLSLKPMGVITLDELEFFIYHTVCEKVDTLLNLLEFNQCILIDGENIHLTDIGLEHLEANG